MKITILQRNIEWANPQANVERADEAINRLPDADLFVLPEMFSTGFCTKPEGVAESADSETLHWMQRKAVERNCAVAGSVAVQENGKYYNRFYFVHPDGSVQHYDKIETVIIRSKSTRLNSSHVKRSRMPSSA